MKMLIAFALLALSTVAWADAKTDYVNAIAACVAANPPPVTDARIACDKAAYDAYKAATQPAPVKPTPAPAPAKQPEKK